MSALLHPYLDAHVVERVLDVLQQCVSEPTLALAGAGTAAWAAAAAGRGLRVLPVEATVQVVTAPDHFDRPDAGVRAEIATLAASGAVMAVVATQSPAGALAVQRAHWPAVWTGWFAEHGWRFVDVIRPVLWDDERLPPDAKEGWLAFVAPGALPSLGADTPLAIMHPDRLPALVAGVEAQIAELRSQFLDGVRSLPHRREVALLRDQLDEAVSALEDQQIRQASFEARLAANERRLLLLMDRQLRLDQADRAPTAPARRWRGAVRTRVTNGVAAGRADRLVVSPATLALFDAAWYGEQHPEAAAAPLDHYLERGEALGFRPNPWFDPLFYAEKNPDVVFAGVNLLRHFADYGGAEGRRPSAEFDTAWYVMTYPEVRASGLNPLLHYLAIGASLGYRTSGDTVPGEAP
ncbi:MAG: hypothetical protein AB7W59_28995 [Acidimicrobiia bacterium]